MIIDCHGHYTTEPKDLHRFRKDQTAAANAKDKAAMPPRARPEDVATTRSRKASSRTSSSCSASAAPT